MNICTVTIPLGVTLSSNDYTVVATVENNGVVFANSVSLRSVDSFNLYVWTVGGWGNSAFEVNWIVMQ